jgi:hypothetical protein
MAKIRIEWLHDSHSCETCGTSYAEGARVYIDGALALDLEPVAHCYDGANYYDAEVFRKTLEHLGHTIEPDATETTPKD